MQQQNDDMKIVRIPHNDQNLKVCQLQNMDIDQIETFFEQKCIVLKFDLNYWINYQTVLQLQELSNDKSEYISGNQIIQIYIQLIRNVQLLENNAIYLSLIQNQDIWIKYQMSTGQESYGIIKTVILSQASIVQSYQYLNLLKTKIKDNQFFTKQIKTKTQLISNLNDLHSYLINTCSMELKKTQKKERLFWSSDLFKNQDQLITLLETELYNQVPDSLLFYSFNNYEIKELKQKQNFIQHQINCIIQNQQLYLNYYDIIQDEAKLRNQYIRQNLSIGYTNYFYQVLKFDCKLNYLELFNRNQIKMILPSEACKTTSIVKYGFRQQSFKYQYHVFWIIMLINKNKNLLSNQMIDDLYQKTKEKLNFHFQEFQQSLIKELQLSLEFEDLLKRFLNTLKFDYVYEQMLNNQIQYSDDESIQRIINQYYQSFLKQAIFQKLQEEINKI